MAGDVQLDEPAVALLDTARSVVPDWLRRVTLAALDGDGADGSVVREAIEPVVAASSEQLLDELQSLLATDVDLQATNPLTLFRRAIAGPTRLLRNHGVAPPRRDAFTDERFPDDVYHLGPATWADVDQRLHEPGLTWGAWKAMTVLRRRRDEGLR